MRHNKNNLTNAAILASSLNANKKNPKITKNGSDFLDIDKLLQKNEVGDAGFYVEANKNKFCYDCSDKKWYKYNGTHWEIDVKNSSLEAVSKVVDAYEDIKSIFRAQAFKEMAFKNSNDVKSVDAHLKKLDFRISSINTMKRMRSILTIAGSGESSLAIRGDEWDNKPMVLCCQNKVIDLKTGKSIKSDPKDYLKSFAPVKWNGLSCKAPVWNKFLLSMFNDDKEMVDYVWRLLGYSLTGMCTEHILPIFYGEGRNGKGTLFEVLSEVLGSLAEPFSHDLLLKLKKPRNSSDPSPDIMDLRGRRIAWASEIDDSENLNPAIVKRLTGNDTLKGRHLFGDLVSFKPTHQLFLLTNKKPKADAKDYALWSRIQLLKLAVKFVDNPSCDFERKRDKNLKEKLLSEKSGILASLVRGCLQWQEQGLCPPKKVLDDSLEYRKGEASDINDHKLAFASFSSALDVKGDFQAELSIDAENGMISLKQ